MTSSTQSTPFTPLPPRTRAVVLGASGFVGSAVTRALLRSGTRVTAVVRDPRSLRGAAHPHLEVRAADAINEGANGIAIQDASPDLVFNLLGYGIARSERSLASMQRMNCDVLREICEALRGPSDWAGARLVHVGSSLEIGKGASSLDERSACTPDTDYGHTKLEGVRVVAESRQAFLSAVTARLFMVFGPNERPGRLVPTLLEAQGHNEPIFLSSGHQARDWTYVDDIAEGLLRLAQIPATSLRSGGYPFDADVVNLATGRLTSVRHFVEQAVLSLRLNPDRLRFGSIPLHPEEMFHPEVPILRLQAAIRWSPDGDLARAFGRMMASAADHQRPHHPPGQSPPTDPGAFL